MTENDELRPEYDLSQLRGGVKGKYLFRDSARSLSLRDALMALLGEFDAIDATYGQVGETDVREAIGRAIDDCLKGESNCVPATLEITIPEGDERLHAALLAFVDGSRRYFEARGLKTFPERLAAFQSDGVREAGNDWYRCFFGEFDASLYDEQGKLLHMKRWRGL